MPELDPPPAVPDPAAAPAPAAATPTAISPAGAGRRVGPAARITAVAAGLTIAVGAYLVGTDRAQVAQAAAPAAGSPAPTGGPTSSPPGDTAAAGAGLPGVEVVGTGKVAGTPDVLRLDLTVSLTRPTASDALGATSTATTAVLRALKAHHVAGKDLKTAGLSLQPNYDYTNGASVLHGYTGSEDVSVTLRDLRTAGAVITAATQAGGNAARVQDIALDLEGDSALLAKARDAAIADARNKAQSYARAAGRTLGRVVVISENTTPPDPIALAKDAYRPSARAAESSVPVQAGSQQVSVSVRVVWAFG